MYIAIIYFDRPMKVPKIIFRRVKAQTIKSMGIL